MQTQFTPNNKLASFGTIGLLFLAGIAGMVFLLPAAHAAGSTVTLSTISGLNTVVGGPTELTGVTSGTVGSSLTLTGTGFASNANIAISSTVGTTTISWFATPTSCGGVFASSIGGVGTGNSLYTGSPACLTTTANGFFKTTVTVPALPGGAQTIVVTDGTNSVSTPFSITPSVTLTRTAGQNYGFPDSSFTGTLTVTGFGSGETVSGSTTAFTTAAGTTSCTTGSTISYTVTSGTSAGTCTLFSGNFVVAETTGGSKTITATGGTSALTASTTYTIKPWAAFYDSGNGVTTFSFIGSAPTSLLVEIHGMTAQTVAANSITVGGVTTAHSGFTIGSSGAVAGANNQIVISPTGNVPFGQANVVVAGTTFSYAAGNIATVTAPVGGTTAWGQSSAGVLISSIQGSCTSTGIASVDAANYKPGTPKSSSTNPAPLPNQVGFFGYGFVAGNAAGPCGPGATIAINAGGANYSPAPALATWGNNGGAAGTPDNNGAFFAVGALGETAWSTAGAPTVAASYQQTVTQGPTPGVHAPANVLSPSFGITPWATTSSSIVDYTTSNVNFLAHGFGSTDTVTGTIGGQALISGATGFGTCTTTNGACTTVNGRVPDLGAGPQNDVITGSVTSTSVTITGGTTFVPNIADLQPPTSTSPTTMNIVSGPAGTNTIVRTGTTYGVHGLYANTAYSIVWNAGGASPIAAGTVIGSFTSTATGGIPVPGVQVTVPADISGLHIVDLQRTAALGTSFMYANTDGLQADWGTVQLGSTAAGDSDTGLGGTFFTAYGDMLFSEATTLVATPTVASVGGTTTISGSGLQANTLYDLGTSIAGTDSSSPAVPSTCALSGTNPAQPPTTIVGQFTSTSGGSVPSGVSVAINDQPTALGQEQGTLYCVFAQTAPNFGSVIVSGTSEFLLEANAAVNSTSGPIGHNFIMAAHGLASSHGYNILFAPYACGNSGNICGTVVGAILTNGQGAGSATFTVPSSIQTASGSTPVNSGSTYSIQLQETGSSTNQALAIPPTFTVSSTSTTSCVTTACMTATGSPTVTQINQNKAVQTSFTNTSNAPVTAIVYAVVHNAAGQTVAYSTATITANAGATATAYDVLFGLAPGTYTVTIFATSTGGTAISGTSTVTVTV